MKTLIYDLETTSTDVNKATPVLMGFVSSDNPIFQFTDNVDEMIDLIHAHDIIIGYNNDEYDDIIMKKHGAKMYGKVIVDLMKIIHGKGFGNDLGRKQIITLPEGRLADVVQGKSLDELTKALKGPEKIGEFDYNLFKKPFKTLTKEQQDECIAYLKRDIEATEHIYNFLEDYFKNFRTNGLEIDGEFRPFLKPENIEKKHYLTSSTASLTYKIICNLAGIEERYGDSEKQDYGGGFVALPSRESSTGRIYCLDYNSLYPHIMIQANLYGRLEKDESKTHWKGEGICETKGIYSKVQHPVGRVLEEMFKRRVEYKKKKDERQYTLKIILNTVYGLLGNPVFASVSDYTAAADCTRLGRQWVNAARLHFAENGYEVLYTDTDSVYLRDPFNDEKKLLEVKDQHINDIKSRVPFPVDTFDMGIDDRIKYIAFFKHGDTFKKKHYIYVTNEDKFVMKGIALVKSDSTALGKKVFNTYIKPTIVKDSKHKFQKSQITEWIQTELEKDISLASRLYKVKDAETYKNDFQIQAQIANHPEYGPGNHKILKLTGPHEKGCGKQANYVGVQFADQIRITQLDLSKTWSELDNFIEETQQTLGGFL